MTITRDGGRRVSAKEDLPEIMRSHCEGGTPRPCRAMSSGLQSSRLWCEPYLPDGRHALRAAIGFVRRLTEGDLVSIIEFETRVEISQQLVGDAGALERAIRRNESGTPALAKNRIGWGTPSSRTVKSLGVRSLT
jgi:hypothetical protein